MKRTAILSMSLSLGVLASLLLLGIFTAGAAVAQTCEPDECRVECHEAKRACYVAEKAANAICRAACSEDDAGCWKACRNAYKLARGICRHEQLECRTACRPDLDLACADSCLSDLAECRDSLDDCTDACQDQTLAAMHACFAGEPDAVQECVKGARKDGRACAKTCKQDHPCGREFRGCLGECVIAD